MSLSLFEQIDHWGQIAPDRPAHVSGGRTLTYGELRRRSDALAAHLAQALPDDTSPVAVLGHKEPEMLIGFLGAVKAGHPYIPLDTAIPPARVARIVATAGASITLTPDQLATLADATGSPPSRRVGPDDPFYVIFTSGSTGEPKGVVITLSGLVSFLSWMLAEHHLAERAETFLNQVPFSFDVSMMDTYLTLLTGGTLFSITRQEVENPRHLFRALAASGVTFWTSTPSFVQLCLAERSFAVGMLPRARRFVFAGEILSPEIATQILERFPGAEVWNAYGPTEATILTTSVRITREVLARFASLPIGYPTPAGQVLVMDEHLCPVPPSQRGEIVIVGPHVSPGYLGRPDLTQRAFFTLAGQRAYRTGDWGYLRDGMVFYEGRMDHQIKLHGNRIELGDVEANLRALPGVRDAVVLPAMKAGLPDALAAFVILSQRPPGSDFEVTLGLRTKLGERVPNYMVPRKFYFLDAFPMTVNGKADRRKLAEALQ